MPLDLQERGTIEKGSKLLLDKAQSPPSPYPASSRDFRDLLKTVSFMTEVLDRTAAVQSLSLVENHPLLIRPTFTFCRRRNWRDELGLTPLSILFHR